MIRSIRRKSPVIQCWRHREIFVASSVSDEVVSERRCYKSHLPDQILKARAMFPPEFGTSLGGVADQLSRVGRTKQAWVQLDMGLPGQADGVKGDAHDILDSVENASGENKVRRLRWLKGKPETFDKLPSITPVPLRVQVTQL